MRLVRRFKASPAMVVACLALLVSLTGTSVAAVTQLVPRNSVGTPQLKNNAVNSAKVRNGSLLRADFRQGSDPRRADGSGRACRGCRRRQGRLALQARERAGPSSDRTRESSPSPAASRSPRRPAPAGTSSTSAARSRAG